jgi:diguanylate cyclase
MMNGSFDVAMLMALATVAAIGYLIGRRSRLETNDLVSRSIKELHRARIVAQELEKITSTVQKNLVRHHSRVCKFKRRVNRMNGLHDETAWNELCKEADEVLRPTLLLASQMAMAYDEIRQQSANLMAFTEMRTDSLTGLLNRRALDAAIVTQFALLNRYGTPFTAAIFDIDLFKEVNDEHGHLYGDGVLKDFAKLLTESVRDTDIVARYGGDEFVILIPETDLAGAAAFCERLRQMIAEQFHFTVSGGITSAAVIDTQETLLAHADSALYLAKASGRNRIYSHDGKMAEPVTLTSPNETQPV